MQTRKIIQVMVFALHLNPVTARCEDTCMVAASDDRDKLIAWYESQLAEKPYRDEDGYLKVFAKGSPLEMFNPIHESEFEGRDIFGHGIEHAWIDLDCIGRIQRDTLGGVSKERRNGKCQTLTKHR